MVTVRRPKNYSRNMGILIQGAAVALLSSEVNRIL
jgi:hypothetical protein